MAFSVAVMVLLQDWLGALGVFYLGCFFGWIFLDSLWNPGGCTKWHPLAPIALSRSMIFILQEDYCVIEDPHCSLFSTLYLTGGGYIDMMDFLKCVKIWYILKVFLSHEQETIRMVKHLNGSVCSRRRKLEC